MVCYFHNLDIVYNIFLLRVKTRILKINRSKKNKKMIKVTRWGKQYSWLLAEGACKSTDLRYSAVAEAEEVVKRQQQTFKLIG